MINNILKAKTDSFIYKVLSFSGIEDIEINSIEYIEEDFIKIKTPAFETSFTFIRNNGEKESLSFIISKEDSELYGNMEFSEYIDKLSSIIIMSYNEIELNSYLKETLSVQIKEITLTEREDIFRVKFNSLGKEYIVSFIIRSIDFFH